jgi:negative regulator of sigma E activity
MDDEAFDHDLLQHLTRCYDLEATKAERLIREVMHFYSESHQQFIKRRHYELQQLGNNNPSIFRQIFKELRLRRYPAPCLTERQIRRIIYG